MIHAMIGFLLFGACIFMARALYQLAPRFWRGAGKVAIGAAAIGAFAVCLTVANAYDRKQRAIAAEAADLARVCAETLARKTEGAEILAAFLGCAH